MTPLAPHDRRLARGRYEVAAYGPRRDPGGRRSRLAGPFRFATEGTARTYAEAITTGDIVTIDRISPQSPRYPEGPWSTVHVDTLNPQRSR